MKLLYDTALKFLNLPYDWGSENPIPGTKAFGYDCSGLVNELLLSVGAHPEPNHRFTAQGLFDYFSLPPNHVSQDPQLGALVFYGGDSKTIKHVAMCLNRRRMIEASGGGSAVTSPEAASEAHAFVKIRPIRFGANLRGIFLPEFVSVEA